MQNEKSIYPKIKSLICSTLAIQSVSVDDDLLDSGVLDSMSLIQLMLALEEYFEIIIPPEELNVEDYRTIKTISEMIERLTLPASLDS
ncbi:MAG: phosphopantetheine-binding protein [Balneolales bacterium]|nr:phosphopantetheine-binding protein [Balneolales bacterium]